MDAARKRNPIMHSTESLKQAEKTLAPRVPADAESGDSTLPTTWQLRASFSQKAKTALIVALSAQRSRCYFKRLVSR